MADQPDKSGGGPQQGGGFVSSGDDQAWLDQDPQTWANLGQGSKKAKPKRLVQPEATEDTSDEASWTEQDPSTWAKMGQAGKGAVRSRRTRQAEEEQRTAPIQRQVPEEPKPASLAPTMEIVNFDGVASAFPDADERPELSVDALEDHDDAPGFFARWRLYQGQPPIRIVRRNDQTSVVPGRLVALLVPILAVVAVAWVQLDTYSELKEEYTPEPEVAVAVEGDDVAPVDGAAAFGTLTVRSNRFSMVFVDGRPMGPAPLEAARIKSGPHHLKVVDEASGEEQAKQILIHPGKPKVMTMSF